MSDNDRQPRPDAFTVLVQVSTDKNMADWGEYLQWMHDLRSALGIRDHGAFNNEGQAWVVGDRAGHWATDHYGVRRWDAHPYANVWQQIEGVASKSMALVWTVIHLVQPLESAGYDVGDISTFLTDTMVVLA